MTYDVGTRINLQEKQKRTQIVFTPEIAEDTALYEPGTRVIFIKLVHDLFTPQIHIRPSSA
jgi:hypothetical protein